MILWPKVIVCYLVMMWYSKWVVDSCDPRKLIDLLFVVTCHQRKPNNATLPTRNEFFFSPEMWNCCNLKKWNWPFSTMEFQSECCHYYNKSIISKKIKSRNRVFTNWKCTSKENLIEKMNQLKIRLVSKQSTFLGQK